MALSLVREYAATGKQGGNLAGTKSAARYFYRPESAQKWLLKGELKLAHQTEAGKNGLQMLDGLEERIGLRTLRCFLAAAQSATNRVESLPQPLQ